MNCARLPCKAKSLRSSGTFRRPAWLSVIRLSGPAFPDDRSKAREDFGPLSIGLEPKEEEFVLVPDFAEEALVPPPSLRPAGAGLNDRS
jgi:hypothetical protein